MEFENGMKKTVVPFYEKLWNWNGISKLVGSVSLRDSWMSTIYFVIPEFAFPKSE